MSDKTFLSLMRNSGSLREDPDRKMWWEPYVLAFTLSAFVAVLVIILTAH